MSKTMLRVLIPQDEYFLREEKGGVVIVKTGKLAMQTVSGNKIKKEMEEKGFSYNKIKKVWERPKVGGVVEDNLMEVLGYVWDENKYEGGKRKKEHYVPYNWQE